MNQRDYILREIQQLAQVLAEVLFLKRAGQADEAQDVLADTSGRMLGLELDAVCRLSHEALLGWCASGGSPAAEKALAVADLLREEGSAAGRERALWLYEAALVSGEAVPFDVYERIASLKAPPS